MAQIFDKINQVATLSNEVRFKILLALFSSSTFKGEKLGAHSHSFPELKEIVDTSPTELCYHLKILIEAGLIEKVKDHKGYYHITPDGKNILSKFGVTSKLVNDAGKNLI